MSSSSPTGIDGRLVEGADFRVLNPEYGDRILVKPAGLDHRLTTRFVGMEPKSYLIVRLSPLGVNAQDVYPFLYSENQVKLFVTCKGTLMGFLSTILAFNAAPYRHLYLAFPGIGEAFTLRQHDRFECHLPAGLRYAGAGLSGLLLDVSSSGCRACLDPPATESCPAPAVGDEAELTFSLLNRDKRNTVSCRIRNVSRAKGKYVLGLSFENLGDMESQRLAEFLRFLARYRRLTQNARR